MASKFCTKCGSPTIAGKRFCGKCGQPIAQPDSSPELTGKTTDTQPIQQASSLPDAVPPAAVLTSSQTPSKQVPVLSDPDVNVEIPSSQPQTDRPIEATPVSLMPEPVSENGSFFPFLSEEKAPVVVDKTVTGSPSDDEISAPSSNSPWGRKALLTGSAALVLILAVSAVWLYVTHVRAKHSQAPVIIATAQPLIALNSSSPSGTNDKPSAATPMAPEQVPATPSEQAHPQIPPTPPFGSTKQLQEQPASPAPVKLSSADIPNPPTGNVQNAPPEPSLVPAAPTSGMLHYSGPPVPYGGTVVFINLPGDRLSFVFDHQSWQPLISRQPDGTQKLTLRSLKQGEQTQCDVEWKVIK